MNTRLFMIHTLNGSYLQVDCLSSYNVEQCDAASLSGAVEYPIDWTVGTGAVMSTDWCPMTTNTATDECPATR